MCRVSKFLGLFLWAIPAFAVDIPGDDLLRYFGASCSSNGGFTQATLQDSRNIINSLRSLRDSEECQTIAGAISQLDSLQLRLNQLESYDASELEIAALEAQETEILTQIAEYDSYDTNPNGDLVDPPAVVASLQATLTSIQQQIVYLETYQQLNNNSDQSLPEIYSSLITTAETTFSTIVSNEACLARHPYALSSIASLSTTIASASLAYNPALSLGLAAATDFIGVLTEGVRRGRLTRAINRISDSTIKLQGFECALESLTNRICEIKDAQKLLDFKVDYIENEEDSYLGIARLYDREIPILVDWFEKVRSGAPSESEADANRRSSLFGDEFALRTFKARSEGIVSDTQPIYDQQTNDSERWRVIRTLIQEIAPTGGPGSSSTGSIMYRIFPANEARYRLMGLVSVPLNGNGNPINFDNFDPFVQWPGGIQPPSDAFELRRIQERLEDWIALAQTRLNQEATRVFQPDSFSTLVSMYEGSQNEFRLSPYQAVEKILGFLDNSTFYDSVLRQNTNPVFMLLFDELKTQLHEIKTVVDTHMDERIAGTNPTFTSDEVLSEVSSIARLGDGVSFIQERISLFVRITLDIYFQNSNPAEQRELAQYMASQSYFEALSTVSESDNLTDIVSDLYNAEAVAIRNLESFVDVFGDNIKRVLRRERHRNSQRSDDRRAIMSNSQNKICLLLASMEEWPREIPWNYCVNTQILPLFSDGPQPPTLTRQVLNSELSERLCLFRDYQRHSRIYQSFGINLSEQ